MVQADAVAIVHALGLRLAQAERHVGAAEVPNRLAALALDLGDPVVAERRQQVAVEGQAALDRGHDEVDVMNASEGRHCAERYEFRGPGGVPSPSACPRPYRTARRTCAGS